MTRPDPPLTRPAQLAALILWAALFLPAAKAPGAAEATAALSSSRDATGPRLLADSTTIETWRLSNGLCVVVQRVQGALGVAVTAAYPTGSDADPPNRRGRARLMAEIQMMGPAGEVPERSRAEMESLRPLGWSLKVGRNATQLSEVAAPRQFAGVLHQVATRMRGVSVTAPALASALAAVKRDLAENLFGSVDLSLYYQARAYAEGLEAGAILDQAAARGLEQIPAAELARQLAVTFAPSNAVLALAGDFGGLDLRALIESEFRGLPARADSAAPPLRAPSDPPRGWFRPGARSAARAGLERPVGVLAVEAPALADTLHPQFFLSMLLIGEHCKQTWNISREVQTRFRYSVLDEPDLVRFYPETGDTTDARALAGRLKESLVTLLGMAVMPTEYEGYRRNVLWLLGGPMPRRVVSQVRRDGAALNLLSNNLAARELTGGEAFWAGYRARFLEPGEPGLSEWARYLVQREHQAGLMFTPVAK